MKPRARSLARETNGPIEVLDPASARRSSWIWESVHHCVSSFVEILGLRGNNLEGKKWRWLWSNDGDFLGVVCVLLGGIVKWFGDIASEREEILEFGGYLGLVWKMES